MAKLGSSLKHWHQARLDGKTTTKAIVEEIFARIKQHETKVGAYLWLNEAGALASAEQADLKLKKGLPIDLIEGMPIAVKDIFNIQGTVTTAGSKILQNYVSPYESTVTDRLKHLNYACVGKTNMDEFAMGSSTEKSAYHITYNPWHKDYVPGGSSGGSAAALVANFCLGAIGTDTGGSIRQPAGFCGVVGLKPTYGRVSRYGMVAFASSLDQAGPLTHTVEDAGLLLERISGYDPRDPTSLHLPAYTFQSHAGEGIEAMTLGVIADLNLSSCSDEVRSDYEKNLESFEKAGGKVKKIQLPNIQQSIAIYYILAMAEASSNLGRFDGIRYGVRQQRDKLSELYEYSREYGFGEEVKLRILLGTFVLSAGYYDAYYGKAKKVQQLLKKQFREAFEQVDAIALPIAPTTAFKVGGLMDDPMKMYLADIFTLPANLAGIPGISIPTGRGAHNLPIGFQLLGAPLAEDKLIHLGQWFEAERPLPPSKLFFE